MNPTVAVFKNNLLAGLPKSELERLRPHLLPLDLPQDYDLVDGKHTHAYFLEDAIASVVVTVEDGTTVEVGVVGLEGFVGISLMLTASSSPGRTFIQIAGSGYKIDAAILREQFELHGELRNTMQRYMQAFLVQTAQTAACNRLHSIEERLARWLLTCHDRTKKDVLPLTHDFLGQMLGAPRTTVTLTAGLLQRAGLIEYARGQVKITNLKALEQSACECYRIVRDEYRRLQLL